MADESMSKVQLTLYLGIASLVVNITCCLSWLYMPLFIGTMVVGYLAIQEANETGEDPTLAKVGMGLSAIPLVLGFVIGIFYCLFVVFVGVAGNM